MNQNFNNNFSKTVLLSNNEILFWNDTQKFNLKIPKVIDVYSSQDFGILIGVLEKDLDDLQEMFVGYKLTSHFDFIRILSAVSERQEEVKPLFNNIRKGLQIILPASYFEKDRFFIEKEIEADRKLFDVIVEVIYTSMNKRFVKQEDIDQEEDEIKKMQKKAKMMAQKIRQKAKKDETSEEKSTKDFEDMLAAVLYEFPQYKLNDLFDLNIYTLHYLFRYVGKIANYEVSKIAAGNGLTKKHKYFIEK